MAVGSLTIAELNELDRSAFVDALDGIVEHTPSIAVSVWEQRPFRDVDALADAFATVLERLADPDVVAVIRAHPRLGTRAAMAVRSVDEQGQSGITLADAGLRRQLDELNAAYDERFGFPFVIAVKGLSPDDIVLALRARLGNDEGTERKEATYQIGRIARFRLHDLLDSPALDVR